MNNSSLDKLTNFRTAQVDAQPRQSNGFGIGNGIQWLIC